MQLNHHRNSFLKATSNNRLLFLCAFTVFWIAFSTFATTHRKPETVPHYQKRSVYFTSPQRFMQLALQSSSELSEMEISSDDDRKKVVDFSRNQLVVYGLSAEYNFDTCVKSRFQQMSSSVNNRPHLALFVFHHSWKHDLS
jgi:hypothetical protein